MKGWLTGGKSKQGDKPADKPTEKQAEKPASSYYNPVKALTSFTKAKPQTPAPQQQQQQ